MREAKVALDVVLTGFSVCIAWTFFLCSATPVHPSWSDALGVVEPDWSPRAPRPACAGSFQA